MKHSLSFTSAFFLLLFYLQCGPGVPHYGRPGWFYVFLPFILEGVFVIIEQTNIYNRLRSRAVLLLHNYLLRRRIKKAQKIGALDLKRQFEKGMANPGGHVDPENLGRK